MGAASFIFLTAREGSPSTTSAPVSDRLPFVLMQLCVLKELHCENSKKPSLESSAQAGPPFEEFNPK